MFCIACRLIEDTMPSNCFQMRTAKPIKRNIDQECKQKTGLGTTLRVNLTVNIGIACVRSTAKT